jgi:formylglycine-generating enzyme required for sulfatase activity
MDKYEASVWLVPDPTGANQALVKKIQNGKAKAPDLTDGGASQIGVGGDDYGLCGDGGQGFCANFFYAVSLPGVTPSAHTTWFQAQAACENARKRLPSNAEWQMAVIGSPDPGADDGTDDCNTSSTGAVAATGSRTSCVSLRGAFDMVGNLYEWVADWVPRSTSTCGGWDASVSPTGDSQCLIGAATTGEPGALLRGGNFGSDHNAGPHAILANLGPSTASGGIGFRCAR